jgi:hypothetical protein
MRILVTVVIDIVPTLLPEMRDAAAMRTTYLTTVREVSDWSYAEYAVRDVVDKYVRTYPSFTKHNPNIVSVSHCILS